MPSAAADAGTIHVEAIHARAGHAWRFALSLPVGATAGSAMAALRERAKGWPEAAFAPDALAVFGREIDASTVLRDGDRLELLRALPNDPKRARRARAETTKPR